MLSVLAALSALLATAGTAAYLYAYMFATLSDAPYPRAGPVARVIPAGRAISAAIRPRCGHTAALRPIVAQTRTEIAALRAGLTAATTGIAVF
jgi:hypothetical protein